MASKVFGQDITSLSKRVRISRAQKMTLITVTVASLILGASIVLIIFLSKYIKLNMNAIGAKNDAINNYSQTILNVGICEDVNNDGKITASEASKCSPNDVTLDKIEGTLQYNVMIKTAHDKNLESVAEHYSLSDSCLDSNGKTIDFLERYQKATDDEGKKQALESMKTCSALRVIPDALPAQRNVEGASASLDWLLKQAGVRYTSLSPDTSSSSSNSNSATAGLIDSIPLSLSIETSSDVSVFNALATIEKSIRTFDVDTMKIEWSSNNKLNFVIKNHAYYSGQKTINEHTKNVTTKGVN